MLSSPSTLCPARPARRCAGRRAPSSLILASSSPDAELSPPVASATRRSALALGAATLLVSSLPSGAAQAAKPPRGGGDASLRAATATLVPTAAGGSASGTVTIRDAVNKRGRRFVEVVVSLKGLSPGVHGINIHELGNVACSDGACTGPSFNPDGLPHGNRDSIKKFGGSASHFLGDGSLAWRHVGDLGNIVADASGAAVASFEEPVATLAGEHSVVGRSVVIHAAADDGVNEPGSIVAYGTLVAA